MPWKLLIEVDECVVEMLLNTEHPTKDLVFQAKCLFNVVDIDIGLVKEMSASCFYIFAFEDGCTLLLINDSEPKETIENAINVLLEDVISQCTHSIVDFYLKASELALSSFDNWNIFHTIDLSLDVVSLHFPIIC